MLFFWCGKCLSPVWRSWEASEGSALVFTQRLRLTESRTQLNQQDSSQDSTTPQPHDQHTRLPFILRNPSFRGTCCWTRQYKDNPKNKVYGYENPDTTTTVTLFFFFFKSLWQQLLNVSLCWHAGVFFKFIYRRIVYVEITTINGRIDLMVVVKQQIKRAEQTTYQD